MTTSSRSAEFKVLILLFTALSIFCTVINIFTFGFARYIPKDFFPISRNLRNAFLFIGAVELTIQVFVMIFCLGRVPKGSLCCSILAFVAVLVQISTLLFVNGGRVGFWFVVWIFKGLFSLFSMLMTANYALISANGEWWEQSWTNKKEGPSDWLK